MTAPTRQRRNSAENGLATTLTLSARPQPQGRELTGSDAVPAVSGGNCARLLVICVVTGVTWFAWASVGGA